MRVSECVHCISEQVAAVLEQTPGLRLLSDRWWSHCRAHLEGEARDTDFVFGLCLFQLLMYHSEAKVALIWSTEHSSWFCACFMVLFPVYNSCSRKPNYVMQICLELYSVLKPADTQSHNQNIVARTYNPGCCENWMAPKYNSVASFEMRRISTTLLLSRSQCNNLHSSPI